MWEQLLGFVLQLLHTVYWHSENSLFVDFVELEFCNDTDMFGEIYISILAMINELTTASILQRGRLYGEQ